MINVLIALVLFIILSSLVVYWIIEQNNKTINELYKKSEVVGKSVYQN